MKTTADSKTLSATDSIEALKDFSDRLSPIVVKELRQGLRQASFVILFLFLQSVLAMVVISALFATSSGTLSSRIATGNMISGFFFGLFALATFVIQPVRALNTLSSEINDSTIDLLLLTRMDAWRIVFGKWLCLITQSALLLIGILPYLIIRYFLGGMNLLSELSLLVCLFILGAMVCAAGVGMSAIHSKIIRGIFVLLGIIGIITLLQDGFILVRHFGSPYAFGLGITMASNTETAIIITGSLLFTAFITHAFLEFGATRIAPPAENRSTRKRLIALFAAVVIPLLFAMNDSDFFYLSYVSITLIGCFSIADALSEYPRRIQPINQPKYWTLRPGWPSGALFALIMLGIISSWMLLLPMIHTGTASADTYMRCAQVVVLCLLIVSQPALIIAFYRRGERDPSGIYIGSIFGILALGMALLLVGLAVNSDETYFGFLFPVVPVLGFGALREPSLSKVIVGLATIVLYLTAAAIVGYQRWKPETAANPKTGNPLA